jgi:hypothetical protein
VVSRTVQEGVTQLGAPIDDMRSKTCSIDEAGFAKRPEMIGDVAGRTSEEPCEPRCVHWVGEHREDLSAR